MNINPIVSIFKNVKPSLGQRQLVSYSNLTPLKYDTVSFGGMKKTGFSGINRAVVEKFKAPIEKFDNEQDFQNWCKKEIERIVNKDYGGRQPETVEQRKHMLKEWFDYVLKENDGYTNAMTLLILSSVTKDLRADNDKFPPVLNKGVLADCIDEVDKSTTKNPKYQFDFYKMYATKLQSYYLEDTVIEDGGTGWVIIPSNENDPEHFEDNVEKLKAFSYKSWCTKSFKAKPYLSKGDFHIYLENGKPKLGIRFFGDKIIEIQGERNNEKIPISYLDEMERHINENNLKLESDMDEEIESARESKAKFDKAKEELKTEIETNDIMAIFEYFGIEVAEDEEGFYTISEYGQPDDNFTFSDLGIDENRLLKKVKIIEGIANFQYSSVVNLGNLEYIGGTANFFDSPIEDLGNLKTIGGEAYFSNSKITHLKNLEFIGHNAYFCNSKVIDMGNLKIIKGKAYFNNSNIINLGNLERIGGSADFGGSEITNLRNLESIGSSADFGDSEITNLGNLKSIGGRANFRHSQITNLGNLERIGGSADFSYSKVADLGNLKTIRGSVHIENSLLAKNDFKNIKCGKIYVNPQSHLSEQQLCRFLIQKIPF